MDTLVQIYEAVFSDAGVIAALTVVSMGMLMKSVGDKFWDK